MAGRSVGGGEEEGKEPGGISAQPASQSMSESVQMDVEQPGGRMDSKITVLEGTNRA
jgi:hypothetical protein